MESDPAETVDDSTQRLSVERPNCRAALPARGVLGFREPAVGAVCFFGGSSAAPPPPVPATAINAAATFNFAVIKTPFCFT